MMHWFKIDIKAAFITSVALSFFSINAIASADNSSTSVTQQQPVIYKDVTPAPPIRISLNMDKDDGIKLSDILSGFALLSSIFSVGYTIYLNNKNTSRSIKETFWMREVLIPQFLSRFFKFINEAPEKYKTSSDLGSFYSSYALNELNSLEDVSVVLSAGCDGLGATICDIIEEFQEQMMEVECSEDFSELLIKFTSNVVNAIKTAQINMS